MPRTRTMAAVVSAVLLALSGRSPGADCTVTSVGRTPISELGTGLYLGQFEGGLYPGGGNAPPAAHAAEGRARALAISPMNAAGLPDARGRYAMVSIGMSNTTQEFCSASSAEPCDAWTFMGQAAAHAFVDTSRLVIVNGAAGGQAIPAWDQPTDVNWDRVRDTRLAPKGLTEAQVVALWIKQAIPGPTASLPAANADAYAVEAGLGNILRAAKPRYPNLRLAFLSSRIYAGYASTALNPEPYAYETAFGVKWVIEAQINQMNGGGVDAVAGDLDYDSGAAPWIAWGPYLWADGLTPRADGLFYACADMQNDGTHPAQAAEEKVGTLLLDFMLASQFTRPWFTTCALGDPTGDGAWNGQDVLLLRNVLLGVNQNTDDVFQCDRNCDGRVDGTDIQPFVDQLMQ